MRAYIFLIFFSLLISNTPCDAFFEGAANANIFIRIYTQRGEYGRLALWHETAAECLNLISVPMNEISLNYYKKHGYKKWVERAEVEALEIQEQREYHIKKAKAAWINSKTPEVLLKQERKKIAKFIAVWLPHYPDRFYEFGIYATFICELQEQAEMKKDFARVLRLEADAAEMCAAQYDKIPIEYGLKTYKQHRDDYLRHATLLRTIAKRNPKSLPSNVLLGKERQIPIVQPKIIPTKQTDKILLIAKSDSRIKAALIDHKNVREYAWFQGFAWTVSFYNHGWGNLAIAVIDDKTGRITDVLLGVNDEDELELLD